MGEHALVEELWNVVKTSAPLLIDQGGGGQADRLRARASDYASVGELRAHIAAVCQAAKPGTPIALMARRCATALADYDTRRAAQPPPQPPGRPPKHRKARADGAAPVVVTATAPAPTSSSTTSGTAAGPRRTKGVRRSDAAGAVVVVAGSGVPPAKRPHSSSAAATTAAAATGGAGGSSGSSTGDGAAGVVRPGSHHRGGAGAPGGADAALAALAAEQFRTVVAQAGAGRETSWTARRNPLLGPAVTPDALLQALRYPAAALTGTSSTSTSSSSASGGSGSGLGGGGGGSCSTSSRRRDVALLELQDDIAVLEDEVRRLVNARQYIKQGRVAEAHVLLARADAQRRTQRRHAQLFEAHRAALLAAVDAGAVHTPQSIYDALEIRFNNQLDIHKKHLAAAAAAAAAAATTTAAQQPQQSQQPAARAM